MKNEKSLSPQKLIQSEQIKEIKKLKKQMVESNQNQKSIFLVGIIINLVLFILGLMVTILQVSNN